MPRAAKRDWARSQAALPRWAMIASRVSSLAAESETNAATARCRPSGRVIMPMSLVAEVMPLRVPPVLVVCGDYGSGGQFAFEAFRARDGFGHQLQQQGLALPREATLILQ